MMSQQTSNAVDAAQQRIKESMMPAEFWNITYVNPIFGRHVVEQYVPTSRLSLDPESGKTYYHFNASYPSVEVEEMNPVTPPSVEDVRGPWQNAE